MADQQSTPDRQVEIEQESPWLNAEQQRMWRLWIHLYAKAVTAQARQLGDDSRLSFSDYEVLVHLSEAEGRRLRISALADQLQWDRSRMSHQIRRMEERGLLWRESCDTDGRGFFAVLDPRGLNAIQDAAPGARALGEEAVLRAPHARAGAAIRRDSRTTAAGDRSRRRSREGRPLVSLPASQQRCRSSA